MTYSDIEGSRAVRHARAIYRSGRSHHYQAHRSLADAFPSLRYDERHYLLTA